MNFSVASHFFFLLLKQVETNELSERVNEVKGQAREKLVEAKRVAQIGLNDKLEEALMKVCLVLKMFFNVYSAK